MSAVSTSLIVFLCVFGGALLGLGLRRVVPEPQRAGGPGHVAGSAPANERLYDALQDLPAATDSQRTLKTQALQLMMQIATTHSLMQAQKGSSINATLLVVVVFWLTVIFVSFGLFAPSSATVATTLFVCALSVAGAVFLILEMDQPFRGLVRIADAPMREALAGLGR